MSARNVLGGELEECCSSPKTGWFRDGTCRTDAADAGRHVVCAHMTATFLAYTRAEGNDLSTPSPSAGFPGLREGDRWCLCAGRWEQARRAGVAPPVLLAATEESALQVIPLEVLRAHALDA